MLTTALALILGLTQPALAQETEIEIDLEDRADGFGIGVVLGEPTGITLAYRASERSAVQSHISYSLVRDTFRGNLDYLPSLAILRAEEINTVFPVYVGIGGTVGINREGAFGDEDANAWLGVRVPVGISAMPNAPVDVFAELAPTLYLLPEASPGLEGSIGGRFYF